CHNIEPVYFTTYDYIKFTTSIRMIKLKHKKDGFPKPSFYTDICYKTNAFLSITVFAISRFFAITLIGVWRVSLRNDDNIMRKSSPSSTTTNISLSSDSIRLNASCV